MAQTHDEEQDEKCTRRAQPEIQRGTILIILGISESLADNSVWNEPHHSAMPQCKEHPLNEELDVEQSPKRPNSIQRRGAPHNSIKGQAHDHVDAGYVQHEGQTSTGSKIRQLSSKPKCLALIQSSFPLRASRSPVPPAQ